MKTFENKKIGKLALVAENNTYCEFGKEYILYYLFKNLSELWDVEILLINQENKPISSLLMKSTCKVFTYTFDEIAAAPAVSTGSNLIKSALEFKSDSAKSYKLYQYLSENPDRYDAFVFVGLTHSLFSLLPLTRKRNCIIPLLYPRYGHIIGNNAAVRHALINCDYFFCHSFKESQFISGMQPDAEIRCFPVMVDFEFIVKNANSSQEIELPHDFVLVLAESHDSTVSYFTGKLAQKGIESIIMAGDYVNTVDEKETKTIDLFGLASHFSEIIASVKTIFLFMNKDFYPVLYNFAQHYIPLHISRNYAWSELLDGDGLNFLSFDKDIEIHTSGKSTIMPPGYHHYKYYTNYFLKFINEWSIDNKLRWHARNRNLS